MDVLQKILRTYGDNVSQLSIVTFLAQARDNCSWFLREGVLNITVWKHIGDELGQRNGEKSKSLLVTWQVFSTLSHLQTVNVAKLPHYSAAASSTASGDKEQQPLSLHNDPEPDDPFNPGLVDPEKEPDLYPPDNNNAGVIPVLPTEPTALFNPMTKEPGPK